ncbi:hypothetical protein KGZ78_03780 [Pseudomonas aeruginosa]|nr:hypothetical protein KGZ78_03780 [Pseudomonas aeruginosa]
MSVEWQPAQFSPTQGSLDDWRAFQRRRVSENWLSSCWSRAKPRGRRSSPPCQLRRGKPRRRALSSENRRSSLSGRSSAWAQASGSSREPSEASYQEARCSAFQPCSSWISVATGLPAAASAAASRTRERSDASCSPHG